MTAKWIWINRVVESPQLAYFKKSFVLKSNIFSGQIKITADSRYKLYINGVLVEVGPNKGNFQEHFYDTVDLTKYLHKGRNQISVKVFHYPTKPLAGNFGIHRTKTPGLYIDGQINDGTNILSVQTDQSWFGSEVNGFKIVSEDDVFAPMQIYENFQGSILDQQLFDDSAWDVVEVYEDSQIDTLLRRENLKARPIPFLYRKNSSFKEVMALRQSQFSKTNWERFLSGKRVLTIPAKSTEIVEISANQEMTGYLHLALRQGSGATIKILQSEAYVSSEKKIVNGLVIPVKGDRLDVKNGYLEGFTDIYHVAGYGNKESPEFYSPFWFRTFRFIRLEITTTNQALDLVSFDYQETGYPLEVRTQVETSDSSLSAIWDLSERTLRRCMHETYEDCPFYEQLEYVMDTRVQILYTYAISADDRLARNAIRNFRNSQREDGTLNAAYPSYEKNVIPGFSIYFIAMVYDHMMYFDDKKLLEENLDCIDKILAYFEKNRNEEGYIGVLGGLNGEADYWSFIDWTDEWNATTGIPTAIKKGPITIESLLYVYGLQLAAKIFDHVSLNEKSKDYLRRAETTQKAILNYCLGKNKMLQDGPGIDEYSQHCQVLGVLTNTLDKESGKQALEKTIKDKSSYAQCSVAMSFYLFRALADSGLYQYANSYWDNWRQMLAKNCSTSVEALAGERSECHAWGALALYELPSFILGVRPISPGYTNVEINPQTENLTWAKGTVITPRGEVKISWKKDTDGQLNLRYQLPNGLNAKRRNQK